MWALPKKAQKPAKKIDLWGKLAAKAQPRKRVHEDDGGGPSTSDGAKAAKRQKNDDRPGRFVAEMSKLGIEIDNEELSQLIPETSTQDGPNRRPAPAKNDDFEHVEYGATDPVWTPANPAFFKTEDMLEARKDTQDSYISASSNFDAAQQGDNEKSVTFRSQREGQVSGKNFVKVHQVNGRKKQTVHLNRMSVQEINSILAANRSFH